MKLTQKQLRTLVEQVINEGGIQGVRDLENTIKEVITERIFELFNLEVYSDISDDVHDAVSESAKELVRKLQAIGLV